MAYFYFAPPSGSGPKYCVGMYQPGHTHQGAEPERCRCRTRWGALAQPGEYDWTVHVRRRYCHYCFVLLFQPRRPQGLWYELNQKTRFSTIRAFWSHLTVGSFPKKIYHFGERFRWPWKIFDQKMFNNADFQVMQMAQIKKEVIAMLLWCASKVISPFWILLFAL